MAKDSGARNPYAGFQIPGLTMPPFLGGGLADHPMVSTLTGGMDWIKQLWGGGPESGLAGFAAPTLDVEQIERKITDLRAVESWLQTNAAVLRTTIQALEVQRNTILALQSFGNFAAAGGAAAGTQARRADAEWSGSVPEDWPLSGRTAASGEAQAAPSDAPPPAAVAPDQPRTGSRSRKAAGKAPAAMSQTAAAQASMSQANAWWALLQDQFARVAAAAVGSQPGAASAASPKPKPARKAAGRTGGPAKQVRRPTRAKRG